MILLAKSGCCGDDVNADDNNNYVDLIRRAMGVMMLFNSHVMISKTKVTTTMIQASMLRV